MLKNIRKLSFIQLFYAGQKLNQLLPMWDHNIVRKSHTEYFIQSTAFSFHLIIIVGGLVVNGTIVHSWALFKAKE